MQFIKDSVLLIFLIASLSCMALEELITKQSIHKLRYISNNGKITYYQKNSGELQMSTNYNFASLMKLAPNTHYTINGSNKQKRVVIEANFSFQSQINSKKDNIIYTALLGQKGEPQKLDKGVTPKLHLSDSWISYFKHETKSLYFKSFSGNLRTKTVKLQQNFQRFFTPQVFMLSPNDAIFTDINKEGFYGVFLYSFIENEFKLIYKAKRAGHKLNLCQNGKKLFIGEFPQLISNAGTAIMSVDLYNNNQFKKFKTLYSSPLPDIGNMVCNNKMIYFIKTMSINDTLNARTSEVASISLIDSKVKILTDLKFATQLLAINNMIITPFRGKHLIVLGQNKLTDDAILEEKTEQ